MKNRIIAIILIVAILSVGYLVCIKTEDKKEDEVAFVEEVVEEENVEEVKEEPKQEVKKETKKTTSVTKKNTKKNSNTKKVTYDTNSLKQYAHDLVISYGWSEYDYECLVKLWNRESGWRPNAVNKKSGACGIPQSLPCSKMKSEGSDYKTNGKTQIRWGLKYIKNRYGSPSKAWEHSQQKGWY